MGRLRIRVYVILFAALAIRLYFALTCAATPDYSDMASYNELAVSGGFPTALPPAYPLFLRAIYAVFGRFNYTAVFVVQALLSVGTVLLVYLVTRRISDERGGMIAAAIATVYPNFVLYNLTTMTEAVTLLLVMLLLAAIVLETDPRRSSLLAAAVLAAGFYVRPSFMFFLPGVLPLVRRRMWLLGLVVLLVAPWFVVKAATGSGANRGARMFYKSYNERSDGISNYDLSETELGRNDLPSSVYLREALDFIRSNKWQTVNIIYNKAALILCRGYDQYVLRDVIGTNTIIVHLVYYMHIPIFLLGLVLMIRYYEPRIGVLVWTTVSYLALIFAVAFFKFRYRLPVEPMFVMASGILLSRISRSALPTWLRRGGDERSKGKRRARRRTGERSGPDPDAPGLSLGGLAGALRVGVRSHWKTLVVLLVLSAGLRILFVVPYGVVPSSKENLDLVRLAVEGGFGPADPPLYPLLVRAVFSFSGAMPLVPLYIVQGLIGSLGVLLIFAIGMRVFGRTAAVAAALVATVYPSFLGYGVTIAPGCLVVFLFILLTAALTAGMRDLETSIASGVIVGLGTMVQPWFVYLVPGLLPLTRRRWAFIGALALTLLPLAVRNSIVNGSPVPVYTAGAFGLGLENFTGLEEPLAFIDNLYFNSAILISRGWAKQIDLDLAGIVYLARYGYVLVMLLGVGGLIRYVGREQRALYLPALGYLLLQILFSRLLFDQRMMIEPLLMLYAGRLIAGWAGAARTALRRPRWNSGAPAGVLKG